MRYITIVSIIFCQEIDARTTYEDLKIQFLETFDYQCPKPRERFEACGYESFCESEVDTPGPGSSTSERPACQPGCYCNPGLVRDTNGNCVDNSVCFQFTCKNGSKTIPMSQTCNGRPDCSDGSDEICCSNSSSIACTYDICVNKFKRFMCEGPNNNGACISPFLRTSKEMEDLFFPKVYDYFSDLEQEVSLETLVDYTAYAYYTGESNFCGNSCENDPQLCQYADDCSQPEDCFYCDNGTRHLLKSRKFDKIVDCRDQSDEIFTCDSKNQKILFFQVCDGVKNCSDGLDEKCCSNFEFNPDCLKADCEKVGRFQCTGPNNNGFCISQNLVGLFDAKKYAIANNKLSNKNNFKFENYINYVLDNSLILLPQEKEKFIKVTHTRSNRYHNKKSNICEFGHQQCEMNHCGNNCDENPKFCRYEKCNPDVEQCFTCHDNSRVIPYKYVKDKHFDCDDRSDEIFYCNTQNGNVLEFTYFKNVCDGASECSNGFDEACCHNFAKSNSTCTPEVCEYFFHRFYCSGENSNHFCISQDLVNNHQKNLYENEKPFFMAKNFDDLREASF